MQDKPKLNVLDFPHPIKDIWTKVDPNIDVKRVSSVKKIETLSTPDFSGLLITLFCDTPEDKLDEEREVTVAFRGTVLTWRVIDSIMFKYHDTPSNWKEHDDSYWLFEASNSDYLDWFNKGSVGLEEGRIKHYVINLEEHGKRIDIISYSKPVVAVVKTRDKSHFAYKYIHMTEEEVRAIVASPQGDLL